MFNVDENTKGKLYRFFLVTTVQSLSYYKIFKSK